MRVTAAGAAGRGGRVGRFALFDLEAVPATARGRDVRVLDLETGLLEALQEVDRRALQVRRAERVDDDLDAVELELVDSNARELELSTLDGQVDIHFFGFEGDVAPRSGSDGKVTLSDWVQVGRIVAKLDDVVPGVEFQKTDCAPRENGGDGKISIGDWVQAGRYSAGLDSLQVASGPMESNPQLVTQSEPRPSAVASTIVLLNQALNSRSNQVEIILEIRSTGVESGLGLSLGFDATRLRFLEVARGSGLSNGFLNLNSRFLDAGRLGVAIALPPGTVFPSGAAQLLVVRFDLRIDPVSPTLISCIDIPVGKEVVDSQANEVSAAFQGVAVSLPSSLPRLSILPVGTGHEISWDIAHSGFVLQSCNELGAGMWSDVVPAAQLDRRTLQRRTRANRFHR